jgi:hypothetical protein
MKLRKKPMNRRIINELDREEELGEGVKWINKVAY